MPTPDKSLPVALVTGASRGIGRAVARRLLADGWRVVLSARSLEPLDTTVRELAAEYPDRARGESADLRRQQEVEALLAGVEVNEGRLDCLVNNAGIGVFGPVDELSGEAWRNTLRTNLDGAFYAIRAATPILRRQGGGWIVNVASLAARHPFAGGAAYNASKFGLLGLSDAAMLDLRDFGIRVVAVLPGSVDTGFGDGARGGAEWKLAAEDVAQAIGDLLRMPPRALPSRIELRPTRTKPRGS